MSYDRTNKQTDNNSNKQQVALIGNIGNIGNEIFFNCGKEINLKSADYICRY